MTRFLLALLLSACMAIPAYAAVPDDITDLSQTAASNSPSGSESIGTSLDDYLRGIQKVLRDEVGGAYSDVASATTTDLGAVTSTNVRITGTTTITGFGTVAAGVTRNVRFAAALTLTHNGTSLILPSGANIVTAANDTLRAVSLGSGNWLVTNFQRNDGTPVGGAQFKIGSFTRDLTTATGTQAVTGVGFKPKALIIFGGVNGANEVSWGFGDAAAGAVVYDHTDVGAGTYGVQATTNVIVNEQGSSVTQTASIQSMDADGFTLSWTKTGSPTGTGTFGYLALR